MMSSKNKGFTASDIERYHSGKMLPEDRHALEKAALDDPFLADALEGYAFTSTPADDLAKIQLRLNEKPEIKKVIPFFQKYRWLSAAALIIIVAGAGWLTYSISKTENNPNAVAKKEIEVTRDSSQNATAAETNLPDTTQTKQISEPPSDKFKVSTSLEKNPTSISTTRLQKQTKKEITQTKKIYIPEINATAGRDDLANNNDISNAERRNASRFNPVSNEQKSNTIPNQVLNNSAGKDISKTAPASVSVRNVTTNDTINNLNIVMQPLPPDSFALQEVVVGYGSKKRATNSFPHVIFDTLEPAEGYVNFDTYVANNLKMPDELKTKLGAGEVQLSFNVDKEGKPVDIAVTKSLCQKCDEEAIRLLKEGPKWKNKKNKKGKITIRF